MSEKQNVNFIGKDLIYIYEGEESPQPGEPKTSSIYLTNKCLSNEDFANQSSNIHITFADTFAYENYFSKDINQRENKIFYPNQFKNIDNNINYEFKPRLSTIISNYISHFDVLNNINDRLKSENVKRTLDEFKMAKKLTHFKLPEEASRVSNKKNEITKEIQRLKRTVDNEFHNNIVEIYDNKVEPHHINVENSSLDSYNDPKLLYIIQKQNELMKKLLIVMEFDQQNLRTANSDFEDIVSEISNKTTTIDDGEGEDKDNRITEPSTPSTTNTTTTTVMPTVMSVIDESEIRAALKNDPFVKRILKMFKRKKKEYMDMAEALKNDWQA